MARFQDAAVLWVKELFQINNVYQCARPFLLLLGIFGLGATSIGHTDGVYTIQNTSYTKFISILFSGAFIPFYLVFTIIGIFNFALPSLFLRIYYTVASFVVFFSLFVSEVGYLMTYISCKRLDRMFRILHNIDSQLAEVNIRVQHGQVTLKVVLLALITVDYPDIIRRAPTLTKSFMELVWLLIPTLTHIFYTWAILFLVIIQQRFVYLNRVLQQNATPTNIEIVGARSLRDNYVLRRILLARHVHEQLAEVVQLFSDACRYMVVGSLTASTIKMIMNALWIFTHPEVLESFLMLTQMIRIVVVIVICQANQTERRVLTARLRHLVAFETDREIIHQLQQYIMFNAHSVSSLVDFQFTDIDNVLLLTIIDIVASNMLLIYSYTRPEA